MDISSLSQRVEELERAVSFWNQLYILILVGTAIFAIGVVVTQYVTVERGKQLAAAQKELLNAKDKQLELQTLAMETKLEQERIARIEIEENSAFRRIPPNQQSRLASVLKPFAEQTVYFISTVVGQESSSFASDIVSMLDAAQWKRFKAASPGEYGVLTSRPHLNVLETGVVISSSTDELSIQASDTLLRELTAMGFDSRKAPAVKDLPVPVVYITIQARPEGPQGEAKLRKEKQ